MSIGVVKRANRRIKPIALISNVIGAAPLPFSDS